MNCAHINEFERSISTTHSLLKFFGSVAYLVYLSGYFMKSKHESSLQKNHIEALDRYINLGMAYREIVLTQVLIICYDIIHNHFLVI